MSIKRDWKPPEYPRDPGELDTSGRGELTRDDHDWPGGGLAPHTGVEQMIKAVVRFQIGSGSGYVSRVKRSGDDIPDEVLTTLWRRTGSIPKLRPRASPSASAIWLIASIKLGIISLLQESSRCDDCSGPERPKRRIRVDSLTCCTLSRRPLRRCHRKGSRRRPAPYVVGRAPPAMWQ